MLSSSSKKGDDKAADTDKSYVFAPPAISLPKGSGAIKGMGEKFAAEQAQSQTGWSRLVPHWGAN